PRLVPHNGRAYLASPSDMAAIAERVTEAISGPHSKSAAAKLLQATAELAARCTLDPRADLGIGVHHLPEVPGILPEVPGDALARLRARCEDAILHGRYRSAGHRPPGTSRMRAARTARDRLEHELNIIAHTSM